MKKIDKVKEVGQKTINLLELKKNELKYIFKCYMSYEEKKKAERLEKAILQSIDNIRRSMLDDEVMHS